jgi:hypothetical protein
MNKEIETILQEWVNNEVDKCKNYGCDEEQMKICLHYTNLKPKWKGNTWFIDKIIRCHKQG